jgi:hypothetical protein
MPYLQTNETTGAVYTVYPYLILSTNSEESIAQYLEDQKAKGYEPKNDEASGLLLAFMFNPVPPGSLGIVRTSKGKWIPDMSNLRAVNSLALNFPGLDLGKWVAKELMHDSQLPAGTVGADETPEPAATDEGSIDPFDI